ncbi:MAG: bifunctional molybdenum cofactor biosynthesis protein MoaC/MoaB [Ignavibacteriales bacterium]|nr:bifunctional molybdenum cofactor biosynthesis protein MoaC/MoaB [Ignavibacteriales bacterium]
MLDVSKKIKTLRTATAQAILKAKADTITLIRQNKIPKGNPLEVAKVAAIQAAKNTSQIIPYCHPLPIDFVGVEFALGENTISVTTTVKAIYKTGVEMEALTAASVAVLTMYDMMKMLDEEMEMLSVKLISKKGGKSDFKDLFVTPLRAAVLVMSDSISSGKKDDLSGQLIIERLQREKIEVADYKIIPDDAEKIVETILHYADTMKLDLVLTTGGTGFSPRDTTPEAMKKIIEREIPGIPEMLRAYGQERTPYSMLSRGKAGIRGKTIIVNLPGSKRGVAESLDALFPSVLHSFKMLWGGGHLEK